MRPLLLFLLVMAAVARAQEKWTVRSSGTTDDITSVAYGGGAFVAVDSRPLYSPDGINWTRAQWSGEGGMDKVFYLGDRFLAVGIDSYWISKDGQAGTRYLASRMQPGTFTDAAFLNGTAVLTGLFSDDNRPRRLITGATLLVPVSGFPTTQAINWVISTGSEFLAGTSDAVFASSDGATWNLRYRGYIGKPVKRQGELYSGPQMSLDAGATWPKTFGFNVPEIYAAGYFVRHFWSEILTSPDCQTWTSRESGTTDYLRAFAFGKNTFVGVGYGGRITTSPAANPLPPASTPTLTIVPSVTLKWTSEEGRSYQVESSPDLKTWVAASDFLPGTGADIIKVYEQSSKSKYFRVAVK